MAHLLHFWLAARPQGEMWQEVCRLLARSGTDYSSRSLLLRGSACLSLSKQVYIAVGFMLQPHQPLTNRSSDMRPVQTPCLCLHPVLYFAPNYASREDASHPAHTHVAFSINDLKTLLHCLRFLARAFALLLRTRRFHRRHGCGRSRWLGAGIVEVSFACMSSQYHTWSG